VSIEAFNLLFTHIIEIYTAVLHANFQLGILLLQKVNLLHNVVKVLLKISRG